MYQLNAIDYSFHSKVWKNTSVLNAFFFISSNNIPEVLSEIYKNINFNIKHNVIYALIPSGQDSKKTYPFLVKNKNIDPQKSVHIHSIVNFNENVKGTIQKITETPIDTSNSMWQLHMIIDQEKKNLCVLVRLHHMMGDGNVLYSLIQSIINPNKKRFSIKNINNKYIFLIKNCIKFFFLYCNFKLINIFIPINKKSNPKNIYEKKWYKEDSDKKIIDYLSLPYDAIKTQMNDYDSNFRSLITHYFVKTYNQLNKEDSDKTFLIASAINWKDNKLRKPSIHHYVQFTF